MAEFRESTAIGVDWVSFREISQASDDALHDLGAIMHRILFDLAWPTQIHLNLISLLGKKGGHQVHSGMSHAIQTANGHH